MLFRDGYTYDEFFANINKQRRYKHYNLSFDDMNEFYEKYDISLRKKRVYIDLVGKNVPDDGQAFQRLLERMNPLPADRQMFFCNFSDSVVIDKSKQFCLDVFC